MAVIDKRLAFPYIHMSGLMPTLDGTSRVMHESMLLVLYSSRASEGKWPKVYDSANDTQGTLNGSPDEVN